MFAKINVLKIIRDHLFTLTGSRREKGWGNIWVWDIELFYGIPLIVGIVLVCFGVRLSDILINVGLMALTVFVPLLINVIFLIYSVLDKLRSRKSNSPESEQKINAVIATLQDLFYNISYAVLMSFVAICVLAVCMFKFPFVWLLHGVVYVLMIHLVLTGLMILKRIHVLLEVPLNG